MSKFFVGLYDKNTRELVGFACVEANDIHEAHDIGANEIYETKSLHGRNINDFDAVVVPSNSCKPANWD